MEISLRVHRADNRKASVTLGESPAFFNERYSRASGQGEMGQSARGNEGDREDVVKRTKEPQCSFEQLRRAENFVGNFPWRSVSDSEGMAAFGMLGLQQGDGGSHSTSSELENSGYRRIDSASWVHLLASGGEVPGANIGGRVASPVTGGETDARIRSSPYASGNADDPQANDPGPMPTQPPFGGCGFHGESSRSGSRSAGGSHDSRTGPLRTPRSPLDDVFSSFSFENYQSSISYPPPPYTRFGRSHSASSAVGSIPGVDGGDGANSFYDTSRWMTRQHSFDPLRSFSGVVYPMPRIASDERLDPNNEAWPYHYPVPAPEVITAVDDYPDCNSGNQPLDSRDSGALGRGFNQPHSHPYRGPDRSPHPDGGEKTPEPRRCSPQVDVPVTDYSRMTPSVHQPSDSSEERTIIPSKPKPKPPTTTSEQTAKPSGFDLLASMIPDLSKMNHSKAGPMNSSTGGSTLQASAHSSVAAVGKNAAETKQALGVSGLTKTEVISTVSRSPSPPPAPSTVLESLETEIGEYRDFLHGRPVLLTGRRVSSSSIEVQRT